VATLSRRHGLESIHGRSVGILDGLWLQLGVRVSVGLDALPLWGLGLSPGLRVGVATRGSMDTVVLTTAFIEFASRIQAATTALDVCEQGCEHRDRESRSRFQPRRDTRKQGYDPKQLGGTRRSAWTSRQSGKSFSGGPTTGRCDATGSCRYGCAPALIPANGCGFWNGEFATKRNADEYASAEHQGSGAGSAFGSAHVRPTSKVEVESRNSPRIFAGCFFPHVETD
jgi:hypothetical protein